ALAIIHAHSPFAIVQSRISSTNLLIPSDCESKYFLHEIPIITGGVGSKELAQNAANVLKDHKGAIIKEHGPIAIGKIVEEAFVTICSIEHACKVKYFADLFSRK
ncbi:class II aldolase/adducin family protein, partial [bacterium]|nr:class II aldolase/adducin family protein [bacterium]